MRLTVILVMKTYTQEDVLKTIRAAVEQSSLRQTATRIGISAPFLSDILRGNRHVSETVARAFGFEKETEVRVRFRKIA